MKKLLEIIWDACSYCVRSRNILELKWWISILLLQQMIKLIFNSIILIINLFQ